MGLYDKFDPKQARGDRDFRRERIKRNKQNNNQVVEFNLNWIPQERQLRFLEACGLSHPFKYYLGEDDNGKPKIYKRDSKPDEIQPPEARVIGYGGSAGGGKGQPASGKVVTPYGFREMQDISVGDRICSPTHGNTEVINKYDLGERDIFEVKFADNTSVEVTSDHIWKVSKVRGGKNKKGLRYFLATTEQIKNNLVNGYYDLEIPHIPKENRELCFDLSNTKSLNAEFNSRKKIVDVKHKCKEHAYCLKVSNPNGLYIAGEDYIVTHNSDAMLLALFIGLLSNPGANAGFFRRKFTQLEGPGGAIMRSKELFNDFPGAKWNGTEHMWTFQNLNNAVLKFAHIHHEDDIYDYQSQQFDYIAFDEATQFTRNMYRYLMSRNRVTVNGVYPLFMMATNPGGVGHQWFKREFVSIGTPENAHMVEVEPGKEEQHMFIPAKLKDNIVLEDRDAGYRDVLEGMNEIERERLLEGNWDIHAGQFFPKFSRDIHVIEPFDIPDYWKRFISIDYGLDKSAVYWYALDDMGFYYCYKELYMSNLALSELAKEIRKRTNPIEKDALAYTVASPDLWNRRQETGKSGRQILVEDNNMKGYGLRPADNRRVEGWRVTREYIKPIDDPMFDGDEDEKPPKTSRVLFFQGKVPNMIRSIPALQTDDNNPDDASDEPHEVTHAPESFRYFCMSRPPIKSLTEDKKKELRRKRQESTKPISNVTGY